MHKYKIYINKTKMNVDEVADSIIKNLMSYMENNV